jgi:hypothetical protein
MPWKVALRHLPIGEKLGINQRRAILEACDASGGHDVGDFSPARGSQPGAQAGRHALDGLGDLGTVTTSTDEIVMAIGWHAANRERTIYPDYPYYTPCRGIRKSANSVFG